MIEHVYKATSLNIAMQDGVDAGQSVPHVHVHVIPRHKADLDEKGGSDAIYGMLDGEEGDIGSQLRARSNGQAQFPAVDNEDRKPRSEAEMSEEAGMLAHEIQTLHQSPQDT